MKKIILFAALAMGAVASQAQTTVAGSKFFDNWSFTLKGGMVSPMENVGFFKAARGIAGAELRKQITPIFGLGVEGEWSVNTSSWTGLKSANTFDHQYVGVFGTFNFMNAFAGYTGAPRVFELEAVAGTGWLHAYYPHTVEEDGNSWATKVGLNFNFNLGEAKAWTISLKPAILWNMNHHGIESNVLGYAANYDSNHAVVELEAGVTYHFGNSNGTHHFTLVRPYDQAEVDALNAQINALRADLDACGVNNAALLAQIADLQAQLDACNRRPAAVEKVVKDLNNIRYVFFNISSAVIQPNQQPNVAMVADAMKDNKATVTVDGYASKDGSLAFNEKLAQRRADAVKKELVNRYGIAADRVNAQGKGIGDLFSENDWNRVAVCTVNQ
ncbi:MAG: OmpA family protein [Muribaculaceae bacterium]|nr:OmpA family protein [Muribaculaceae bacterium]RXE73656.1 OmpA family protein [Muribaculaceae bacterium Isolate-013 (NCI)]